MRRTSGFSLGLLTAFLLAACTQSPPASMPSSAKPRPEAAAPSSTALPPASSVGGSTSTPPATPYKPPQPPRQLADGVQLPAVQGLLAAADRALRRADLELAAVNLERAQRLAPQSAAIYQRLAAVRLRQKRPAEAEQLARKALAYAASSAQQALLWRQIAAARQQQGQIQSAQAARERAAALENAAISTAP